MLLNSSEDNRWPGGAECPGGHLESKGHPRGQEGVKQSGGCRMTRSAPNPEWPERRQAAWIAPTSQERASSSGQGAQQRVWSGGRYEGRCCVKISVPGHHSLTKQASFVVEREQRTFGALLGGFRKSCLAISQERFWWRLRNKSVQRTQHCGLLLTTPRRRSDLEMAPLYSASDTLFYPRLYKEGRIIRPQNRGTPPGRL